MAMNDVLWVVLGMAVVTYLPRLAPTLLVGRFQLPAGVRRWLDAVPYAALGALIFPGVLGVDPKEPLVGWVGGAVAVVLSLFRLHILFVVGGAILAVIGMKTVL
jgi:branched-subunit amino acid transport protein